MVNSPAPDMHLIAENVNLMESMIYCASKTQAGRLCHIPLDIIQDPKGTLAKNVAQPSRL